MFLLHFILPLAIFYLYRNKIMLYGLLLGNLIDLDHVYYRITGKIDWLSSACPSFGQNCSIGFYPLHNFPVIVAFLAISGTTLSKNKYLNLIGWISLGAFLNIALDYLHMLIGVGI